jgi:hypothetical protein
MQVNSQIQKLQPNGPDAMAQISRAAGHHRYWYTDGDQQYQGGALEEKSRDVLSVWTPLDLIRPKRLQFGETNAGVVIQDWGEADKMAVLPVSGP